METQDFTRIMKHTEYFKIFFRRKWLVITPAFAGLVLSIALCLITPPTYESSTLIMVEEEKIINPLIQGLAVSTSAAQRMEAIKERLLSWNSLLDLIKKLNLTKDFQSQPGLEGLISSLKSNITVSMRGSNLVLISYQSRHPEQTQKVTKTLTDLLVEENKRSQTKETDVAIEFIKEQLEVYKRKIKESEIAKMQEQLKNLLVDSTEEHPLVKEIRQKIASAEKELESGDYQVTAQQHPVAGPVYDGLKQEIDKIISKEITGGVSNAIETNPAGSNNDSVYKLILVNKADSALGRDINVNENIYNILLQKLETAKITQRLEISKEGTRYTIIEPARLPLHPIKPKKLQLILLGLFLGGASGVGIVFSKELLDQSFLDMEDAKQTLELPILGAISRITTQEEINQEKSKTTNLVKLFLASSVAIVAIAFAVSSYLKR